MKDPATLNEIWAQVCDLSDTFTTLRGALHPLVLRRDSVDLTAEEHAWFVTYAAELQDIMHRLEALGDQAPVTLR